jgi:hypothetical protein
MSQCEVAELICDEPARVSVEGVEKRDQCQSWFCVFCAFLRLQRLAQQFVQAFAIAAAERQLGAIVQDDVIFAV